MPVGKPGEDLYKEIDWDAMTITNNFLFQEVLRNKQLCKHLIENILHIQVKDIRYPQSEKSMTAQLRSKSIRLDLYVTDTENNVYDVEMQTTGNRSVLYSDMDQETVIRELPLRTRYYQSIISTNMLRKGKLYGELRKSYVIFVCTFDPFGKGLPVYHFTYRCSEDCMLQMNDKTECIFLNAKAADRTEDRELAAFLRYVDNGLAGNRFTQELDEETKRVKNDKEWRERTVTWEMDLRIMEKAAEERGRKEGRQETVDDVANLLRNDFNMPEAVISALKEKLGTPKDAVKA